MIAITCRRVHREIKEINEEEIVRINSIFAFADPVRQALRELLVALFCNLPGLMWKTRIHLTGLCIKPRDKNNRRSWAPILFMASHDATDLRIKPFLDSFIGVAFEMSSPLQPKHVGRSIILACQP